MTSEAHRFPVPQRVLHEGSIVHVQAPSRALTLRPALALIASRALPAVTASVAAVATILTAERAVRGITSALTPGKPAADLSAASASTARTVVTEWLTIERRRRTH